MRVKFWESFLLVLVCVSVVEACHNPVTAEEVLETIPSLRIALFGSSISAQLGQLVSAAGDCNGDGMDDIAIVSANEGPNNEGAVYLVFGRSEQGWANTDPGTFNFSNYATTPDSLSWIKISGAALGENLGSTGVAHGDFNDDGIDDLIISSGAPSAAYVIFGHDAWSSFVITAVESDTIAGFRINSKYEDATVFVGDAGDMNGDGIEDMFVSQTLSVAEPFVVFGQSGNDRDDFNLSGINGLNGFQITGVSSAYFGKGIMGNVGDVNGDGLEDLAIGDPSASNTDGQVFVVFAKNTSLPSQWGTSFDVTTLNGSNGAIITGFVGAQFGATVVTAGDLNNDGFDDIFIGVSGDYGACVVFGRATWASPISTVALTGSIGFLFTGAINDFWGYSGGGCGDVNGDGIDDLTIGSFVGTAVVIFGRQQGVSWPATITRTEVLGGVGFQVIGASNGLLGYSARGAGDLNNDGVADIIFGSYNYNFGTGMALLLFGRNDHCAECSSTIADTCAACRIGFGLGLAGTCTDCSLSGNTWSDGHTDCTTCPNCVSCAVTSGVCSHCNAGFGLTGHGNCTDCSVTGNTWSDGYNDCVECPNCTSCAAMTGLCSLCNAGFGLDATSGKCLDCSLDGNTWSNGGNDVCITCNMTNNCTRCDSKTGDCASCPTGMIPSGNGCIPMLPGGSTSTSTSTVIVVVDGSSASVAEVIAAIATLLGVDATTVTVVEVTPGTFEITVSSDSLAHQLVDAIKQCMNQ